MPPKPPALALPRRSLLGGALATAAAARALLPGGAHAQAAGPETASATIGWVALTDAAPLFVAQERGLFAKHGMPGVRLARQDSWAAARRNLREGVEGLDGSLLQSSVPYLMRTGRLGGHTAPVQVVLRLNTGGQAIALARSLQGAGVRLDPAPLRAALGGRAEPAVLAIPYKGGTHDLWLRYWLAAAGIDPDTDVSLQATPPGEMVEGMRVDIIAALVSGEPLGQQAANEAVGYTACMTDEIWPAHPEKCLALRADWVGRHPRAAAALAAAVIEAQVWADNAANRPALAALMSRPEWLGVPAEELLPRLSGRINYGDGRLVTDAPRLRVKFWEGFASYPYPSHDLWFLLEGMRWGYHPAGLDTAALVRAVNREDVWRQGAALAGAGPGPAGTSRGVERFFDGVTFDPANPQAYLQALKVTRLAG